MSNAVYAISPSDAYSSQRLPSLAEFHHLVIPERRPSTFQPSHMPSSPTKSSVLQPVPITMNTPSSTNVMLTDDKEYQRQRPPVLHSQSQPVISLSQRHSSTLSGSLKTLIETTVGDCTSLVGAEIENLRVQCATLQRENKTLEKEFLKLRYERDIAMSRLRMLSGKVVAQNQGFQSFKRPIEAVEDAEDSRGPSKEEHPCLLATAPSNPRQLPSPSCSRTASPFIVDHPLGDGSDDESDDEVEVYTLVSPAASKAPSTLPRTASRVPLSRNPSSYKARCVSRSVSARQSMEFANSIPPVS